MEFRIPRMEYEFRELLRECPGTLPELIDLLMGLFRGAVFRHGGGALKQPIKQLIEMPTSTLALMGRFPSLMGRFPTLMGRFTDFVLRGRFTSWKSTGKQPIKKRGIKRFLKSSENGLFAPRAFFSEIGVVPSFWIKKLRTEFSTSFLEDLLKKSRGSTSKGEEILQKRCGRVCP